MRRVARFVLAALTRTIAKRLARRLSPSLALTGAAVAVRAVVRHRRRFELAGKNALVTGGGRGLGLEIARVLVSKGANVAIVARNPDEIELAVADLRERARPGVRLLGVVCDLKDVATGDTMLDVVRAELGALDVLVNNAGMIEVGPLDAMTLDDFEQAMQLHCFVPLRLMLAVKDDMRVRGGGRIANISSVGGVVSVPHLLPYSTSKFALTGLSRGMHSALAGDGIRVTTVTPGLMRTGSPRNASFKGDHRREFAWFTLADSLPLLSVGSKRAARLVVRALEQGEANLAIGWAAKLAGLLEGVAPNVTSRILELAAALLPQGNATRSLRGFESGSRLAPSLLTALNTRAEIRNNQL
jgi:NAD(P)-dependent dehydrogenase (short-subunit alcohol dehydrogenase family)